jgi:hypothetical protein
MMVDENYMLQRQCAVKPVIMTDTVTGAKVITKTLTVSCQSFLQHCDTIKDDVKYVKNYLLYQFNEWAG